MKRVEDDSCKIEVKCKEIHGWAHACLDDIDVQELHQAHELGNKILEMLNQTCNATNFVKFVAVFEVLSVGTDVLEHDLLCAKGKVTIQ